MCTLYNESTERINSLNTKISKIDKTFKGYIDGRINKFPRLINQDNTVPNPVLPLEPTSSVEGVRNKVRQLKGKNMTDELIIEGLRGLVADVKEQLDKTLEDNCSIVARPGAEFSEHVSRECKLIKGSVEGSAPLIQQLMSTKVNTTNQ